MAKQFNFRFYNNVKNYVFRYTLKSMVLLLKSKIYFLWDIFLDVISHNMQGICNLRPFYFHSNDENNVIDLSFRK